MRIIAGEFRSRAVRAGKDDRVRPTSDKVKGALFNMLGSLEGTSFLDLYSGTGNLGLEALSRGAKLVVFVDRHPASIALIRSNLESLGIPSRDPRCRILPEDALTACLRLKSEGVLFDTVIADPPYEPGVLKRVQETLKIAPLLAPGGILAVEHGAKDLEMSGDFPWPLVRHKVYGDTALSLFRNGEME